MIAYGFDRIDRRICNTEADSMNSFAPNRQRHLPTVSNNQTHSCRFWRYGSDVRLRIRELHVDGISVVLTKCDS